MLKYDILKTQVSPLNNIEAVSILMRISLKLISLLLLILLATTSRVWADNTLLTGESMARDGDNIRLEVRFEQPMNYISHFPNKSGDEVDIKLRPIASSALGTIQTTISDSLNLERSSNNPVQDITYEQDEVGNGVLTIQFSSKYDFTIEPSPDHLSVFVTLLHVLKKSDKSVTNIQAGQTGVSVDSGLPIYVINLQTDDNYLDPNKQPVLKNFRRKYDIYTIKAKQGRRTLYQLRLGYFHSLRLAKEDVKRLKPFYPQAWVDKVMQERRQVAENWFFEQSVSRLSLAAPTTIVPKVSTIKPTTTAPTTVAKPSTKSVKTPTTTTETPSTPPATVAETAVSSSKQAKLLEIAKQFMISKNYRKAVNYLTHILQMPNSAEHKQAQELLGLARERMGLPAQAVAEYEKYLKLYPTGADSDRVRQRLNGLLTATAKPNAKLSQVAAAPKPAGPAPKWNVFGSFTQFYRNSQSTTSGITSTTDNSLSSDLVLSARRRGTEWNQRIDFAGNYLYNFLKNTTNTNSSTGRIYSMFYELAQKTDDFSMRIGRQTHNSDGVLGRFDGITLTKRIGLHKKFSFLAGYPVDIFFNNSVNTNRQFYAGSIKFESIIKNLDSKFYYITQSNYGMTDRQAIGNETQYVDRSKSLFFITDYDVFYKTLNQMTFVGNWRNKQNSSLNVVADYRKSPLMTTNNALIGQTGVSTLQQLRQTFSLSQVDQMAMDRTGSYKSLTVSATTQLGPRYQLNGDVTASKQEGTVDSFGVPAVPGTGTLYYYNLALVGTNMISSNDVTIAGMRYLTNTTSRTISANFSTRLNSSKTWRINPRISIDWLKNDNGTKSTTYTPRLVLEYRAARSWRFDIEFGYQKIVGDTPNTTSSNYYGYFGYIHDF